MYSFFSTLVRACIFIVTFVTLAPEKVLIVCESRTKSYNNFGGTRHKYNRGGHKKETLRQQIL